MDAPLSDLAQLLRHLEPDLHEGDYAFVLLPHGTDLTGLDAVVTVHETEGLTVVVPEAVALAHHWPVLFRAAWITLRVHSDLNAVGLTAAFAGALAQAGISCNVVAGARHDHHFVPIDEAAPALAALRSLQLRS